MIRTPEQARIEVEAMIEKLDRQAKAIVSHEGNTPSNTPRVVFEIAKYGADNIYMTLRDYHSHYDDDDCYFSYYNNVTGETFSDSWTTRFAAPPFDLYECVSLGLAIFAELPVNEDYVKSLKDNFLDVKIKALGNTVWEHDCLMMNRLVTVKRGRKWTGTGWLVGKRTQQITYYRTRTLAIVFDPETETFNECAFHFCELADADTFKNEYAAWLNERVADRPATEFVPSVYTGNYDVKGTSVSEFYREYIERHPAPDWKAIKIAELTETMTRWAASKPDKTDEERALMVKRAVAKKLREMGMGE